MSDLQFGARVVVTATVRPIYVQAHNERREASGPGMFVTIHHDGPLRYRCVDNRYWWTPDDLDENGIPGEPLHDAGPLPERKGTYRMLRRFPADARGGVVVGSTWRAEGQYHDSRGDYYGEPEPAYLAESRRIPVLQVALDPGDVGARPWPLSTVLVLPTDVEVTR